MIRMNSLLSLLFLIIVTSDAKAKDWRGIIPLKSTRADVERLIGKPTALGHYQIKNERVTVWYSEGPCESAYPSVAKPNCECLIPRDTVRRVVVTLESPVKVSTLGINKKEYEQTIVHAQRPTATYSDFVQGVVYTILESENTVSHISYLPSAKDCAEIVNSQTPTANSGFQGIVPLGSTRADVERLLGVAKSSLAQIYTYHTPENRVDIRYSSDPCKDRENSTPSGKDSVLKLTVSPQKRLLVQDLNLDKDQFIRIPITHPENWVHYLNSATGITIEVIREKEFEQVVSIIYEASAKARELWCTQKHARP